jgi:hypothetical protein
MKEFGIDKDYVPDIMKSTLPTGFKWVDHVSNNLKSPLSQKENHKLNFLNKIRNEIDAQLAVQNRKTELEIEKEENKIKLTQKWDDFRQRREVAITKYLKAKRLQRAVEKQIELASLRHILNRVCINFKIIKKRRYIMGKLLFLRTFFMMKIKFTNMKYFGFE